MLYVVIALILAIVVLGLIIILRPKPENLDPLINKLEQERDLLQMSFDDLQSKFEEMLSSQDKLIKEAREDSIKRSKSTISGKIMETFAPYLPSFPYNPKDCRFLGTPNDFIIFNGMDEGKITEVIILEIKSGQSSLSSRQRDLRNTVQDGNVRWEELKV